MRKSWKSLALAAGAAVAAAPLVLMGSASAVPAAPTITSVFPTTPTPGSSFQVNGTGCTSTAQTGALANVQLTSGGQILGSQQATTTNLGGGLFTATFTVPTSVLPGGTLSVTATCSDNTGTGVPSQAFPVTVGLGAPTTTGSTSSTGTLALSGGTTLTGGNTSATGVTTDTSGTVTGTVTGVTTAATPITQTPNFTG